MIRLHNVRLPLRYTDDDIRQRSARELRLEERAIDRVSICRLSIDARHKNDVHYVASIDVHIDLDERSVIARARSKNAAIATPYRYEKKLPLNPGKHPLIVGAGPAGLFAALTLAESGIRPLLIDRGSDVDRRTQSIGAFWDTGALDPECNVLFGEGGAGTFSDGKLNTGTKDSRARRVLEVFARHGAPDQILYQAMPHIGTDRLRLTVKRIRQEIIRLGGEVCFDTRLSRILTRDGAVCGAEVVSSGATRVIECTELVLAIGHSARDTFTMLDRMGVLIEPKAFSVGVRIEHLRQNIDRSQYGESCAMLPAAYYKENVRLKDGRGVYTFCMCPGGTVVAAASERDSVVTNGMSEFARDRENSNAALLVSINPEDIETDDRLKGMHLQRSLEQRAYRLGGGDYRAPVQRVGDFLRGNRSTRFGSVLPSYRPGTTFAPLRELFPAFVTQGLQAAIPMIDLRLHGFADPDAVLTGVESRSSSPIRIVRDDSMQSVTLRGLYPCGEGAGYAGGIVSAAVDGIKVAERIIETE